MFERFIQLAGGKQARIVFVPSAGFRRGWFDSDAQMIASLSSRYSSWARLAAQKQVASFQFLFTDDPEDADSPQFTRPLETATGVWFSGGDQLRLNYRFVGYPSPTRFQRALAWVLQRGGVVGGTSAGMAAIPEIMTLWDQREDYAAPAAIVPGHGFGLLRQAIVEQHFDARAADWSVSLRSCATTSSSIGSQADAEPESTWSGWPPRSQPHWSYKAIASKPWAMPIFISS